MNLKTPTATMALGGLALLLLVLGGWFLVISPANAKLTEAQDELASVEDSNFANEAKLRALQAAEKNLPTTREAAGRLAGIFPATADQPGFFNAVNDAAQRAGISEKQVGDVSPSVPVGALGSAEAEPGEPLDADLATQTVSITVDGSYTQISELLDNLSDLDRAVFLESVSVSGGEGDVFNASITATTFVAPPLVDPSTEEDTTDETTDAGAEAEADVETQ